MSDSPNSLAPLPLAVLRRVQRLQSATRRELRNCHYPGTNELDDHKALEILRTSLVEEISVRLTFYEALPGLDWECVGDILVDALWSALACFPQNKFIKRENNGQLVYESNDQFLNELVRTGWNHAVSWRLRNQNVPANDAAASELSRRELASRYRAAFPDVKIADICWAAEQTYREWRRWINGKVRDGLKPDRAFRLVLTSGKKPEEIRKKPRPTKYNV